MFNTDQINFKKFNYIKLYNFDNRILNGICSCYKESINQKVTFINKKSTNYKRLNICNSLIFTDDDTYIADMLANHNYVVFCENPRREFCRFYFLYSNYFLLDDVENIYIDKTAKLMSGVQICNNVTIYEFVTVYPNAVIGVDGHGFERDENTNEFLSMPQIGDVIIESYVQIGANVTVCRGSFDSTIIGKGSKIGNNTNVGHNCIIGENVYVSASCCLCGSSKIGNNSWIAPGAIIRNGIVIGENCHIGLGSVVVKDILDNTKVKGVPAKIY